MSRSTAGAPVRTTRRHSMITRAVVTNAGICTVALLALATIFLLAIRSTFHAQLLLRAQEVTEFLASQSQYPLLIGDWKALDRIARTALQAEDVLYVSITDATGGQSVRIARSLTDKIPGDPSQSGRERVVALGSENAFEVTRPVASPVLGELFDFPHSDLSRSGPGTVRVGFSMRKQEALFARMIRYSSAVGVFLLFCVVPLQAWELRRLLLPLHDLILFTRRIGAGDLSARALVRRVDEVGELTIAFNQMIDQINNTTVSRDYVDGVLQCMGESLIVTNAAGNVRTVNKATLALLGNTREEVIGQPAHRFRAIQSTEPAGP